ncbi:MAG: 6-phosphofructokinase [Firmicutes bacterium]|nr:6-phosphofructokinase [Bacillota bacterium]
MNKKICIIASGGDAPGMNACIEGIVNFAPSNFKFFGAIGGYDGLVNDNGIILDRTNTSGISHISGCFLKCGRSEEFTTPEGVQKALATIKRHKFDAVIILGGNGSLSGAMKRLEPNGINVIGIPSTIDNDVFFTKNSLGFSSAFEESVRLVDNLNITMRTNNRDHVVQLMGWYCPDLTNSVGLATFADIIDTFDNRHSHAQIAKIWANNRKEGKQSNLMILQETKGKDIHDEAIHSANYLGDLMRAIATENNIESATSRVRMSTLGHLQRGASPSARDRWLGANYAKKALELINAKQFGVAIGLVGDHFIAVPLSKIMDKIS